MHKTDKVADFVNPKDLPEGKNIVDYLVGETDGGLDYTYDATGVVSPTTTQR
jgi:S-(hydroxymethyl)glutathione dehydrogenase/alcohol dehydrogenase